MARLALNHPSALLYVLLPSMRWPLLPALVSPLISSEREGPRFLLCQHISLYHLVFTASCCLTLLWFFLPIPQQLHDENHSLITDFSNDCRSLLAVVVSATRKQWGNIAVEEQQNISCEHYNKWRNLWEGGRDVHIQPPSDGGDPRLWAVSGNFPHSHGFNTDIHLCQGQEGAGEPRLLYGKQHSRYPSWICHQPLQPDCLRICLLCVSSTSAECDIRIDFDTNEYSNIFVSRK